MSFSASSTFGGGGFQSCILGVGLVEFELFWKARLMFESENSLHRRAGRTCRMGLPETWGLRLSYEKSGYST